MAIALSPDRQTIAIDLQGGLWTLPIKGGAARAHHRRVLRRAAAGVVAGRQDHRVPGLPRRHVAHLDRRGRRHESDGGHLGSVRRSRAALVAGRRAHRVLVRSQRQLRHLDARREDPAGDAGDQGSGERLHADAGRPTARRSRSSRIARRRPASTPIAPGGAERLLVERRRAPSARRRGRPTAKTSSTA